jgi:hypothetical protein
MAYSPDPTNPAQPTTAQIAGNMAFELQALKGYIQSLIAGGTNFSYIGGFRNRLKNGSFSVAQRGNSISVPLITPTYTLDQWQITSLGAGSAVAQTNVVNPPAPRIFLTITGNSGATTSVDILQKIESLDTQDLAAGTILTVSGFLLVSDIAVGLPTVSIFAPTVLDNWAAFVAASVPVPVTLVSGPLTASTWQFFSTTITLTADCTKGMGLKFNVPVLGTKTINLAQLQLEKGIQHTSLEWRPMEMELAVCQRYYQTFLSLSASVATAGAQVIQYLLTLPVTMRAAPTVARVGTVLVNATLPGAPAATTGAIADAYTSVAAGVFSVNYTVTLTAEL